MTKRIHLSVSKATDRRLFELSKAFGMPESQVALAALNASVGRKITIDISHEASDWLDRISASVGLDVSTTLAMVVHSAFANFREAEKYG